jgi:hypothetical protein
MRARVLFGGLLAISIVLIAGTASAKLDIKSGYISGPGIEGRIRIEAPDTVGLWSPGSMWWAAWTTAVPKRARSWG